jgi:uncharacterized protein (TIGR03067 family)
MVLACMSLAWAMASAQDAQPPAKKPDVAGQPLTTTTLKEMLDKLGFEAEVIGSKKDLFLIRQDRDGWKIPIHLYVSDNGEYLWLYMYVRIDDPQQMPAEAMLKLLEQNHKILPAHFSFNPTSKRLFLNKPVDNVGLTNTRLREAIDSFDELVRKNVNLWSPANFRATPKVPALSAEARKELDAINGKWVVVERTSDGKAEDPKDIADLDYTFTFEGGKLKVAWKGIEPKEIAIGFDVQASPMQLDLINVKAKSIERAILKREAGVLTICLAKPGTARPSEFTSKAASGHSILVLKRAGDKK